MNINQFYEIEHCIPAITVQLSLEDSYLKEGDTVDERLLAGDYEGIKFPVVFIHYDGRRWEDILGVGAASLYVISEKIKNIFESNNLTGWKTFPVEVLDKRKRKIEGYYGMSITGKCGPVDNNKSEIVPYKGIPYLSGEKAYKGYHVGLDKWDGSDFFIPEGVRTLIGSQKVADVFKENQIKRLKPVNLADVERWIIDLEADGEQDNGEESGSNMDDTSQCVSIESVSYIKKSAIYTREFGNIIVDNKLTKDNAFEYRNFFMRKIFNIIINQTSHDQCTNINQFYEIENCMPIATVQLSFDDSYLPQNNSEHERLLVGDYEGIKFPVIFMHEDGNKLEDILITFYPSLYIISEKIKNIFERNNLTGWKTFPIEVLNKEGRKLIGYYGMSITGKCGPVDNSKPEIVPYTRIPYLSGEKAYKGYHVGLDKWDGSDFFVPEGVFAIIGSQKVADVFKANRIKGLVPVNLADVERWIIDLEKAEEQDDGEEFGSNMDDASPNVNIESVEHYNREIGNILIDKKANKDNFLKYSNFLMKKIIILEK